VVVHQTSAIFRMLRLCLVVVATLATAAYAQHAQAAAIENCRVIGALPTVIHDDGLCYRFPHDLVYDEFCSGTQMAIQWLGRRGELYFDGHKLILNGTSVRGIVVGDLFSDPAPGEEPPSLRVFEAHVEAPTQQYSLFGRAFQATRGARLEVYNAITTNVNVAFRVDRNASLIADTVYSTYAINRQAPERDQMWDIGFYDTDARFVYAISTQTQITVTKSHYYGTQVDDGTPTQNPWPPQAASIRTTIFPFEVPDGVSNAAGPTARLSDITIVGTSGPYLNYGDGSVMKNIYVTLLPILGNGSGFFTNYHGFGVGCDHGASATIIDCTVDMSHGGWPVFRNALYIVGTAGTVVDGFTAFGSRPFDFYSFSQSGLINVDSFSAFDVGHPVGPSLVQMRRLNVNVLDDYSYGMTVTNWMAYDPNTGSWASNTSVAVEDSSFTGGAVGVLLGSGAQENTRLSGIRTTESYYGVYQFDFSDNVNVRDSALTKHCIGVHQDGLANNLVINGNSASSNSANLDLYGTWDTDNNAFMPDTADSCPPTPFIFDASSAPLRRRRSEDPETRPRLSFADVRPAPPSEL